MTGGDQPASHSGCSTPGENALTTHCIQDYVAPKADLHTLEMKRKVFPCQEPSHNSLTFIDDSNLKILKYSEHSLPCSQNPTADTYSELN